MHDNKKKNGFIFLFVTVGHKTQRLFTVCICVMYIVSRQTNCHLFNLFGRARYILQFWE